MRHLVTLLCTILILSLVFSGTFSIHAAALDWDNYDWENIDPEMDELMWMGAHHWLENKGTIHILAVVRSRTDGFMAQDVSAILSRRLQWDPMDTINKLAKEDTAMWQLCVDSALSFVTDWGTMAEKLESVQFPGSNTEKEYEVLAFIIDLAKREYGVEINNPYMDRPEFDVSDYDWENFSIIGLDDSTWNAMCDWFRNDGDLHTIFFVAQRTDGFYATDISCIMSQRFMADPETFLYALAKEEESTWKTLTRHILLESYPNDMVTTLESVSLSGPEADDGYEVLAYMIASAEEIYGTEIHNPQTGDFVGVFVALLVVSGLSGAVLLTQRKRFIA